MNQPKIEAPKKLSDAIIMALGDLIKVESMPEKYRVDMDTWHTQTGNERCAVCFAGSVMAMSLECDSNKTTSAHDFDNTWIRVFEALNCLRCGDIREAFFEFGYHDDFVLDEKCDEFIDHNEDWISDEHVDYEDDPAEFKSHMRKVADKLMEAGL